MQKRQQQKDAEHSNTYTHIHMPVRYILNSESEIYFMDQVNAQHIFVGPKFLNGHTQHTH